MIEELAGYSAAAAVKNASPCSGVKPSAAKPACLIDSSRTNVARVGKGDLDCAEARRAASAQALMASPIV